MPLDPALTHLAAVALTLAAREGLAFAGRLLDQRAGEKKQAADVLVAMVVRQGERIASLEADLKAVHDRLEEKSAEHGECLERHARLEEKYARLEGDLAAIKARDPKRG